MGKYKKLERTIFPSYPFYEIDGILLEEKDALSHLKGFISEEQMNRLRTNKNIDFRESAFKSLWSLWSRTQQNINSSKSLEERKEKCFERAKTKASNMRRERVNFIVAIDNLFCIGKDNKLPWKQKDDLKHFQEMTTGEIVVMGYNTYKEIGKLPNRENRVLTTKYRESDDEDVIFYNNPLEAIEKKYGETRELFIIGGEQIYTLYFDKITDLYMTIIDTAVFGDAYFPDIPWDRFETRESKFYPADERNEYDMTISHLRRVGKIPIKAKKNKLAYQKNIYFKKSLS